MKRIFKIQLLILGLVLGSSLAGAVPLPDTVRLYFKLDVAELSKESVAMLDSLVYYELLPPSRSLFIIGYADNLGGDDYNLELSGKRAKNVQDYLAGLGIRKTSVKLCTGKGEVRRDKEIQGGYRQDRRVDIVAVGKQPINAVEPVKQPTIPPVLLTGDIDTSLASIKVGQTLVLRNIYFYAGRHVVKEESMTELLKLYSTLVKYPKLRIGIEGHVCCVPNFTDAFDEDTFEQSLSLNRAKYIYEYLVEKGIRKDRLSYKGFGRTHPIVAIERTLEDEDANRRVEIRVMEN
jgi:outer membrane protein OmpA-like peptidoglycan-associated protein